MEVKHTARGFETIAFDDRYGNRCSLQQSSAIDLDYDDQKPGASFVWLGRESMRMHLDRQKVSELVAHLGRWLETGSFAEKKCGVE